MHGRDGVGWQHSGRLPKLGPPHGDQQQACYLSRQVRAGAKQRLQRFASEHICRI